MKKVYLLIFIVIILTVVFFAYQNQESKVLFVGDMFFDRYIREVGYAKGNDFIFSCINNFLKDANVVVGNLEGPITENPSKSLRTESGSPENFTFTFPSITAKTLARNNIKIVNLGNNHIGNFGKEGIASTKKYLSEAGINYFGGLVGDEPVFRNGKISFISYNEFGGDSPDKVAEKIKKEKSDGQTVIIYAHWGDEYVEVPQRVKNIANLFANPPAGGGADLIVGSHPHIILPSEKINNTIVYYSLGNFIFDQYWDKNVSTGLVLEVHISDGNFKIIEHKVSLNRDGRTCLLN